MRNFYELSDTGVAQQTFLDLTHWFKGRGERFDRESFLECFFVASGLVGLPGLTLPRSLTMDGYRGLKIVINDFFADPIKTLMNEPELIDAINMIVGKPRAFEKAITSRVRTAQQRQEVLQSQMKTKPRDVRGNVSAQPKQYSNLFDAIRGELGETAAEISQRWPVAQRRKKPTLSVLRGLATTPEAEIKDNKDGRLLLTVYEVLRPNLSIANYSPGLQGRLAQLLPGK